MSAPLIPEAGPPEAEFTDRIARLISAPGEVFWRECFLRGASTRSRTIPEVRDLGGKAEACGRSYARQFMPLRAPMEALCREIGLDIRAFAMPESPSMEIFALFEPPATIFIRPDLLADCDAYIQKSGLCQALGRFRCEDVVLAHEFFHFLENRDGGEIFTRAYREPAGLFRRKNPLPPLSEIAAMSFAGELLGFHWSPFLLDSVMLHMHDMLSALAIVERLERFAAECRPASPGT